MTKSLLGSIYLYRGSCSKGGFMRKLCSLIVIMLMCVSLIGCATVGDNVTKPKPPNIFEEAYALAIESPKNEGGRNVISVSVPTGTYTIIAYDGKSGDPGGFLGTKRYVALIEETRMGINNIVYNFVDDVAFSLFDTPFGLFEQQIPKKEAIEIAKQIWNKYNKVNIT